VGIERSEDKAETDTYEAYVAPTLRAQVFPWGCDKSSAGVLYYYYLWLNQFDNLRSGTAKIKNIIIRGKNYDRKIKPFGVYFPNSTAE
jgi:hypothetical protein